MKRRKKKLSQNLGREPEIEELAEYMDVKVERIVELNSYDEPIASLDQKVGSDNKDEFLDFITDDEVDRPPKKVEEKQKADELMAAIESILSPKEAKIIQLQFGLNGSEELSNGVIGEMVGISRERVRQVSDAALQKLRDNEETRKKLRAYLT